MAEVSSSGDDTPGGESGPWRRRRRRREGGPGPTGRALPMPRELCYAVPIVKFFDRTERAIQYLFSRNLR